MTSKLDISYHVHDATWKTKLRPYCKTVQTALDTALSETKLKNSKKKYEIAIVLADDKFIKELNSQYRSKNKPTNVLSFPTDDGESELGDIILALETIEKEAKEQGKTFRNHTTHLLVHGFLHLLGHDHMVEKEAAIMEGLEIKILKKLDISNPYL